ncbi:hypothetical protein [Paenibacillus sp. UNC451MF]|nr:hypothetical protein [Paenibacillus sp. UNC451MF]
MNVLQVKVMDGPSALSSEKVETESMVGAQINDGYVLFSKAA